VAQGSTCLFRNGERNGWIDVQDCDCIGMDYEEEDITLKAMIEHMSHSTIHISDHEKTHDEMAMPGQFKDEKNWVAWHNKLEVFLGGLLGVTAILLSYSYVIHWEEPDSEMDFESFI
jgi:hypothetical protein